MVSGTKKAGRASSRTFRVAASLSGIPKQVARKCDPGDVVQRIFVNRNTRKLGVDHDVAKVGNRDVGGDRDHFRARRHEFQDALVAEFDDLFDHLRFARIEDSFLLGGIHDRSDSFFLRDRTVGGLIVGNARQGARKFEKHAERPNDPQERANDESQAHEPAPFCARQQEIRNKLGEQKHFDEHIDKGLHERVPRAGNKHDDAARGLGRDQHQPQIREQAKSGGGSRALQSKVRFDLGLEEFEMLADTAFGDAAEFPVNPVDIRKNDEAHAERRDGQHIEK